MSLTKDVYLTADPGVVGSILDQSYTFMEIATVILLPSTDIFKVCARSTGLLLVQACHGKKCG